MLSRCFEPFFGEARIETGANPNSEMMHPPLLYLFSSYCGGCLNLHVTDLRSNYWKSVLSIQQLDDMRDNIGVGDSLAEFIDYVIDSIKSDSKLIVEAHSESTGCSGLKNAKLVAQRSKGMPFVSISLNALDNYAVSEAVANLSWIMFKQYERMRKIVEGSDAPLDLKRNVDLMENVIPHSGKGTSSENQTGVQWSKLQKMGLGHPQIVISDPVNKLETMGASSNDATTDSVKNSRRERRPRGAVLQYVNEE